MQIFENKCNLESSPRIWTLQCRRFNHRSGVWVSKMIKCTINLSQNEQRLFSWMLYYSIVTLVSLTNGFFHAQCKAFLNVSSSWNISISRSIYEMRLSMIRQRNARVTHFAKDYVNNINVTIPIQWNAKVQLFLMFYIPEIFQFQKSMICVC